MKNLSQMMKQAQEMQGKMQDMQARMEKVEMTGQSGAGLVSVILNGKGEMRGVHIDPSLVSGGEAGMIEDLIVAAFNDAKAKLDARVADEMAKALKAKGDDYSAIMVQALADRFAEAMAEYMHEKVRKELWGYAADETLGNDELIKEKYPGIRPAPGYPAQPDHTEKELIFKLLEAEERIGVSLTTSFAMSPAPSVSGLYFAHPESAYFAVGRIEKDQVEDYARRKGWDTRTAERWLAPILNYDPYATNTDEEAA